MARDAAPAPPGAEMARMAPVSPSTSHDNLVHVLTNVVTGFLIAPCPRRVRRPPSLAAPDRWHVACKACCSAAKALQSRSRK